MLNITRLLGEIDREPRILEGGAPPAAPAVVVWNTTRQCNLACRHCYAAARRRADPDELTPGEGRALVADLARSGVRALVLSGGEPLLRPDLPDLARLAADRGLHVALSTNGTLVDAAAASRLAAAGIGYVGVSVDGLGPRHDRMRGVTGAWAAALAGLAAARDAGLRVGLRFTLCRSTLGDLDRVLDLAEAERVDRAYVSHLVTVGRARRLSREALGPAESRHAVEALFDRAETWRARGIPTELVTGSNDADGVALYLRVRERAPVAGARLHRLLRARGGNPSGIAIAGIDVRGDVHPDQFWSHLTLGSVRQRSLGAIWGDPAQPALALLRQRPRPVGGRCGACDHLELCQGGNRVRAEALTGDPWASDPGCHLTGAEIGVDDGRSTHAMAHACGSGSAADDSAPLECGAGNDRR